MNAEQEVKRAIEHFFETMDIQDLEAMEKLIPETNSTVHIGTDQGEIWKGWQVLRDATKG